MISRPTGRSSTGSWASTASLPSAVWIRTVTSPSPRLGTAVTKPRAVAARPVGPAKAPASIAPRRIAPSDSPATAAASPTSAILIQRARPRGEGVSARAAAAASANPRRSLADAGAGSAATGEEASPRARPPMSANRHPACLSHAAFESTPRAGDPTAASPASPGRSRRSDRAGRSRRRRRAGRGTR